MVNNSFENFASQQKQQLKTVLFNLENNFSNQTNNYQTILGYFLNIKIFKKKH